MAAAQHAGLTPERLGGDPHAAGRRGPGIEHALSVGHRRHHERAVVPDRRAQGADQPERPALDRTHSPERRVYEEDAARPHAERVQLGDHLAHAWLAHGRGLPSWAAPGPATPFRGEL